MSDLSKQGSELPAEQRAIRAKCFHPSGTFVDFKKEEIEQTIPRRFEKIVQLIEESSSTGADRWKNEKTIRFTKLL